MRAQAECQRSPAGGCRGRACPLGHWLPLSGQQRWAARHPWCAGDQWQGPGPPQLRARSPPAAVTAKSVSEPMLYMHTHSRIGLQLQQPMPVQALLRGGVHRQPEQQQAQACLQSSYDMLQVTTSVDIGTSGWLAAGELQLSPALLGSTAAWMCLSAVAGAWPAPTLSRV